MTRSFSISKICQDELRTELIHVLHVLESCVHVVVLRIIKLNLYEHCTLLYCTVHITQLVDLFPSKTSAIVVPEFGYLYEKILLIVSDVVPFFFQGT